jgi:hypothetical protein
MRVTFLVDKNVTQGGWPRTLWVHLIRDQPSRMPFPRGQDPVRVGPHGAFRRLAGNGPYSASWRVTLASLMLSSERYTSGRC